MEGEQAEEAELTRERPRTGTKSTLERLRFYLEITRAVEIARRYVAMNGFDGLCTSLGVVVGSALGGTPDPAFIVSACAGASVAMGMSGLWGTYMAERAERKREIRELENHMQRDLTGSILERASRVTVVWVSIINALAASVPALVPAIPFVLVPWGWMSMALALQVAVGLCLLLLFLLGVYVGRVSEENPWLHGALMVACGLAVVIVLDLILSGPAVSF